MTIIRTDFAAFFDCDNLNPPATGHTRLQRLPDFLQGEENQNNALEIITYHMIHSVLERA